MMKTKKLFITAVFSLFSILVWAQNPPEKVHDFNLEQCINYAYEHQTSVLNAAIDQKIADAKVKETIGIGLPQISASADLQDFLKLPTSLLPGEFFNQPGTFIPVKFGVKYSSSLGAAVNQLIFDGSYLVGLQASKTYRELSEKTFNRTKIETNVAVTKAFYMVLVNNKQLDLLNANISQLKTQLDQTQALFDNGFAEKIDADRLRVIYNNLLTEKQNVERSLGVGITMLKFQMGMPVTDVLTLSGTIEDVKLDKGVFMKDTTAYQNRIEYSLAQTAIKLNQLDLKRYKSAYMPNLSAFGSGSYQYQNNKFSDLYDESFPTMVIGLKLNVPIFSGGQRYQKVKQAEFEVLKSQNDLFQTKNSINLDIENSITKYTNAINSLESQQRNLDLANEVLRVSKIKYEQGVGSSLEVTQAQTSLKEAENNYINALYDAVVSKVDTEKATGVIQ
ncbi:TolC family protein [Pelobium manganitolerans]|uniref:TolC family protein n=1 Tax=Pelobium manganitolerans TaxID=1842495 RepID=UPI003FA3A5CB